MQAGVSVGSIHRRRRFSTLVPIGAIVAVMVVAPAFAGDAPWQSNKIFDTLTVVSERELADMRGGFTFAGMEMQFGANARTFIDGVLALETIVTLTDSGPLVQQITPGPGSTPPMPGAPQVFGPGSEAGTTIQDIALPSNVDLSALADANGVVVNDHKGFTAALHQVTADRIMTVLVNTGNGRAVKHELDVHVTVPNFTDFQQSARAALLNSRLSGGLLNQ